MSSAEFEEEHVHVIGFRLPDGTEFWPGDTWHGRSIETTEDRKVIFDGLMESARNLGIDDEDLMSQYQWLVRTDKVYTVTTVGKVETHSLTSPQSVLFTTDIDQRSVVDAEGYE